MNKVRLHGQPPYSIVAVHGGPGGVGEARPFAEKLAQEYGVIEPFLLSESLEGQLDDLRAAIERYAVTPVILIGHSYGAMLSYIFAARYPKLVKKLILVSSGVLEAEDTEQINKTRLSRLSNEQKDKLESVRNKYANSDGETKNQAFMELFTLVQQADAYDLLPHESDLEVVRPQLYERVWRDMVALRDSGDLVKFGSKIACPVVAIHSNYDPRSGQAIKESLSSHVKDFQFISLEKCGHYPWYEKQTKDQFYAELRRLVSSSDEHSR